MPDNEKVSVLLVDDTAANLVALEALLESPQYDLVRATSGEEALRQVLDRDFAAIVMDAMMPTMDGFETARLIKQREHTAHIPIIFLTAVAKDKRFQDLGYESGAVDYLTKPVDEIALKAKLAVFADLFKLRDALRRETAAHKQLQLESDLEIARQQADILREQGLLARLGSRQTTRVSATFHGEKLVSDALPEVFADFVSKFSDALDMAVDGRVHATEHDVSGAMQALASMMAFLGAGPRDVVEVHKAAVAAACNNRPVPKVRLVTEEGRYLLVELMGNLLGLYRGYYTRRVGPLAPPARAPEILK